MIGENLEMGQIITINDQDWLICEICCTPGSSDGNGKGSLPTFVSIALLNEVKKNTYPGAFAHRNYAFYGCPSHKEFQFPRWKVTKSMLLERMASVMP